MIDEELANLSEEVRELYLGDSVPVLSHPPTALEFLRGYVSPNKPVLIRGAIDHWPALSKWTNQYLKDTLGSREVTVAVTPHGLADSIVEGRYFALPLYEKMPFGDFMRNSIEATDPTAHGVHYIQLQNDSLRLEFQDLLQDVDIDLPFASEALGERESFCFNPFSRLSQSNLLDDDVTCRKTARSCELLDGRGPLHDFFAQGSL